MAQSFHVLSWHHCWDQPCLFTDLSCSGEHVKHRGTLTSKCGYNLWYESEYRSGNNLLGVDVCCYWAVMNTKVLNCQSHISTFDSWQRNMEAHTFSLLKVFDNRVDWLLSFFVKVFMFLSYLWAHLFSWSLTSIFQFLNWLQEPSNDHYYSNQTFALIQTLLLD